MIIAGIDARDSYSLEGTMKRLSKVTTADAERMLEARQEKIAEIEAALSTRGVSNDKFAKRMGKVVSILSEESELLKARIEGGN